MRASPTLLRKHIQTNTQTLAIRTKNKQHGAIAMPQLQQKLTLWHKLTTALESHSLEPHEIHKAPNGKHLNSDDQGAKRTIMQIL